MINSALKRDRSPLSGVGYLGGDAPAKHGHSECSSSESGIVPSTKTPTDRNLGRTGS